MSFDSTFEDAVPVGDAPMEDPGSLFGAETGPTVPSPQEMLVRAAKKMDTLATDVRSQARAAEAWATVTDLDPIKRDLQIAENELADIKDTIEARNSIEVTQENDFQEAVSILNEAARLLIDPMADLQTLDPNKLAKMGFLPKDIEAAEQEVRAYIDQHREEPAIVKSALSSLDNKLFREQILREIAPNESGFEKLKRSEEEKTIWKKCTDKMLLDLDESANDIIKFEPVLSEQERAALERVWTFSVLQKIDAAFRSEDPSDVIKKLASTPKGFEPLVVAQQALVFEVKNFMKREGLSTNTPANLQFAEDEFARFLGSDANTKAFIHDCFVREKEINQAAQTRAAETYQRLEREQAQNEVYLEVAHLAAEAHPEMSLIPLYDVLRFPQADVQRALQNVLLSDKGLELEQRFPQVFAQIPELRKINLFLEKTPEESLKRARALPGKESELEGPRFLLIQKLCVDYPQHIHLLAAEGFSLAQLKTLTTRVFWESPQSARTMVEELKVKFEPDEQQRLVDVAVEELLEKNETFENTILPDIRAALEKRSEEVRLRGEYIDKDQLKGLLNSAVGEATLRMGINLTKNDLDRLDVKIDDVVFGVIERQKPLIGTSLAFVANEVARAIGGHVQSCSELFAWKQKEVAMFFKRYPEDRRIALQRLGFKMPSILTAMEAIRWHSPYKQLRGRSDESPEAQQEQRIIEEAAQLAIALENELMMVFPEREEELVQRRAREASLRGELERVGDLNADTMTAPLFAQIRGEDFPVVYKPAIREPSTDPTVPTKYRRAGEWIPYKEGITREWLVGQIDKIFGFNRVPATVLRQGPEGIGTAQEWRVGKTGADEPNWNTIIPITQLEQAAILDILVKQCDGHPGNHLVTPDRNLDLIDRATCLSPNKAAPFDGLRSVIVDRLTGTPIPQDWRKTARVIRENPRLIWTLQQCFEFALRDGKRLFGEFLERFDQIAPRDPTKESFFPKSEWMNFPPPSN